MQSAFVIAYFIRQGFKSPYVQPLYRNMALILFLIQVLVTFFSESFKNVLKRGYYQEFAQTLRHVSLIILLSAFYLFVTHTGGEYSRIILVSTGIIYAVLSYTVRLFWKAFLKSKGFYGKGKRSLIIITASDMVETVIDNIRNNNYEGFQIAGLAVLDKDMSGQTIKGIPVVADADSVVEYVCREWVDEVFINLPKRIPLPKQMMDDFIEMGVTVHLKLIEIARLKGQKQRVERMGTYTVLTTSINMATARQAFFKRAMDVIGGLAGCVITAVLTIILAPCIYIKSPGPIFFSQTRIGKNGKKFKLYKFRSMYMDAEERKKELMEKNRVKDGFMFKLDSDPRIIGGEKGIGGIIRRYSLDEWPQMWNVLKGDMSLVGTRPPTVDEWEKYDLHHRVRLAIKPGITGMWQVSGRSDITDFEEVVRLDKKYITEWSFGMDVKILFRTVGVVFGKNGAM